MKSLDFYKADEKAEQVIDEIFTSDLPKVRHLFANAITPKGVVDFINNITQDCKARYILKGQPGTGRSTLIKKVINSAIERGHSVEIFHCAFDPDSVDMMIIPSMGVAVLDGSYPHIIEPERPGDKVIDMLECVDTEEIDKQVEELDQIETRNKALIDEAIANIAKAKSLHDDLEVFYINAMDFEGVDATRNKLFNKILGIAAEVDKS